jgi:hypothetical protein
MRSVALRMSLDCLSIQQVKRVETWPGESGIPPSVVMTVQETFFPLTSLVWSDAKVAVRTNSGL